MAHQNAAPFRVRRFSPLGVSVPPALLLTGDGNFLGLGLGRGFDLRQGHQQHGVFVIGGGGVHPSWLPYFGLANLTLLKRSGIELVVHALLLEQRAVVAALDDAPVLKH
jgi:hypothetical protein